MRVTVRGGSGGAAGATTDPVAPAGQEHQARTEQDEQHGEPQLAPHAVLPRHARGTGRSVAAAATARRTAAALLRHSSCSVCGSLSATSPAPACT